VNFGRGAAEIDGGSGGREVAGTNWMFASVVHCLVWLENERVSS